MKKLLVLILVLCISVFVLSSCNGSNILDELKSEEITTDNELNEDPTTGDKENENPTDDTVECNHYWIDADCNNAKVCLKCEKTDGKALGHAIVVDAKVEPTCTKEGKTEGKHCSRCNEVLVAQVTISALGHKEETIPAMVPTCTQSGLTVGKKCSDCGEILVKQTVIEPIEHTQITIPAVGATCTEDGLTAGKKCFVCGEVTVEQTVIEKIPHTEVIIIGKNATCTKEGITDGVKCLVCNEILVEQEIISVKDHTEGNVIVENEVAADCENAGSYENVTYCVVCNCEISREKVTVDILDHTESNVFVENEIAPDCVNAGSYDNVVYCTICGEELSRNTVEISTIGHTESNVFVENEIAPDCVNAGSYDNVVYCTTCGEEISRETITVDAFGHTAGDVVIENEIAPDCVNTGSYDEVVYCTVCSRELSRKKITVDATGHTEEILYEVAPTCTEAGLTAGKKCSVCDVVTVPQKTVVATGHTKSDVVIENEIAPDCVNTGSYDEVVYCTTCGDELSRESFVVLATGHTDGPVVIENAVDFNCTMGGSYDEVTYCTTCGEETSRKTVTTSAAGHAEEFIPAVEATCTEEGLTAGKICSVCGEVTVEQKAVAALGHKEVVVSGKAATCTENGLTAGKKCSVCFEITVEQEEIPAMGHTESDVFIENEIAPDCVNTGSYDEVIYCTACGEELSRNTVEISTIGHTEGNVVVENEIAPDCINIGSYDEVVYCVICGCELSRETITVDAFGHTAGDVVIENEIAPDCINTGSYENVVYCTTCDVEMNRVTVEISALGHTDGPVVIENAVDFDCTNGGSYDEVTYCTTCGEETSRKTVTTSAAGHVEENISAVDPTCTETGLTAGKKCIMCGKVTLEQKEIPALGHSEESIPAIAPTCTEDGLTAGKKCSVCGEVTVEQEEIPALGHTFDWSRSCSKCGAANDTVIDGLDIDGANMHKNMYNIFSGDTVYYETVMFLDYGETKQLLFPIDEIISVERYDGRIVYEEGRDYQIIDGKIYIPTTSTINLITSNVYYNFTGQAMLYEKYNGKNVSVYWGEGTTMTQWQIRIKYKHSGTWDGFRQETYIKNFEGLIKKLIAGEDVTFIFYGDSITCGATSSWFSNHPTANWDNPKKVFYQWSYSMLFTQALADMFGYTINFIDCSALQPGMIKEPPEAYVGGTNGTITYINTSVGGWTSQNGVDNFNLHIKPYIQQYGCDLLGVAFGMNDASVAPATTANNVKTIYQKAMALDNDFYGLVISTMVPNNISTNGWYGNQYKQEAQLEGVVSYLNSNGVGAGLARVTSVSLSVLDYKDFRDSTGNNINHPNDFMHRIYAQTCLQAFIGYENIKSPYEHKHTEKIIAAVAPTCTESGLSEGVECSVCGEVIVEQTTVSALGHDFPSAGKCSRCDEIKYSEGLAFTDNGDGTCFVSGIGTCTDTELYIPPVSPDGKAVTAIGNKAFYYCHNIITVVIPDSVTSISEWAFYNCTSLTSIEIPDSVTSIDSYAFSGCYKLVEVINHSSLNIKAGSSNYGYVGYYAKEVHNGESKIVNQNGYLFYTYNNVNYLLGCVGNDTDLILPENYNGENYEIYKYAFCNCTSLTSVVIPDSVTSIGEYAFFNCTTLVSVKIGDGVISIGYSAFSKCINLTSVEIGNNVTTIGIHAFSCCNSLTSVIIPDSVTTINERAFYDCKNLVSIVISNNVTCIDNFAFYYCENLTIYCKSISQPSGWGRYWNDSNCPVVWGYTG